ncbi:MAG: hypothetical protein IJL61_00435 [Bacteroidales bacterium]|nr:hypothetical protein [Bacteroidales bacterium]
MRRLLQVIFLVAATSGSGELWMALLALLPLPMIANRFFASLSSYV